MPQEHWNEETRDQVAAALRSGQSMGEIARDMGVTRNVVVGRVYRDGSLHQFAGQVVYINKRLKTAKPAKPIEGEAPASDISGAKPLLDLDNNECRWPVADVEGMLGRHLFCAAPVEAPGLSYCRHHQARSRPARLVP